jgi:prepilin-type N-terminal cleavage/methylation domain-containing protein
MSRNRLAGRKNFRQNSFSLVELLVVMGIIAVLAALTLAAASGVMNTAARRRATSEIAAMKTQLESYKVDNGGYPVSDGILLTNNYLSSDGSGMEYQTNSEILFQALSGKVRFTDTTFIGKSYMNFKASQVGTAPAGTYIADPFGLAYGYSTGTLPGATTVFTPFNGANAFDLWTTGGVTFAKWSATPTLTNAWINNWQ